MQRGAFRDIQNFFETMQECWVILRLKYFFILSLETNCLADKHIVRHI